MTTNRKTLALLLTGFGLGIVAAGALPLLHAQDGKEAAVKGPKWLYGMNTKVRRADEADFSKDTKKVGVEVFKDENNGNLIYISESGAIAVVPGK